nr:hypothetical protein GCM10017745_46430 [Saccharothrix mutabilis subsp. capreolus]
MSDPEVRDFAMSSALSEKAADAERLWTELTRAAPAPERAEPATLLAFSAYLRGNATVAALAARQAEAAQPGHRLAGLLRMGIAGGLPPAKVRDVVERAMRSAAPMVEG